MLGIKTDKIEMKIDIFTYSFFGSLVHGIVGVILVHQGKKITQNGFINSFMPIMELWLNLLISTFVQIWIADLQQETMNQF